LVVAQPTAQQICSLAYKAPPEYLSVTGTLRVLNTGMHGYCAPGNRHDTLIPRKIRPEAEETVEHRSYNETQHNRMAVLPQMKSFGLLLEQRKKK
jgi:hypothetical protein